MGTIHVKLYEIRPVVLEEMSSKKKLRTNDRQRPITIAHLEPSAQVSLKLRSYF